MTAALRAYHSFFPSPAYLPGEACRWEWEEWIKRELELGKLGLSAGLPWS